MKKKTWIIIKAALPSLIFICFACLAMALQSCGGSDDKNESPETQNVSSTTEAYCYYIPDEQGGLVNLGEVTENNELERRLEREVFIATCAGDINIITTTTTEN